MMPKLASWLLSVLVAMPVLVDGWLGVYLDPEHDAPRVREFVPGSPAEAAGMKAGDVILALDTTETPDLPTLVKAMSATRPGQRVAIRVLREDKELTLAVTLGEKPQGGGVPAEPADPDAAPEKGRPPVPAVEQESSPQPPRPTLGIAVTEQGGALRVTRVVEDSAAARAGMQEGDVLRRVQGKAIATLQELEDALVASQRGGKLAFVLARGGEEREVEVDFSVAPPKAAEAPARERKRAARESAPVLRDYDAAMAAAEESGLAAFVVYGDEREAGTQSQLRAIDRDVVQSALPGYVVVYVDRAAEPELLEQKRLARLPAVEIVRGGEVSFRHDGFLPAAALRAALVEGARDGRKPDGQQVPPVAGSEVEALRAEVEALREEVKKLRAEIDSMRSRQRFR